MQKRVIFVGAGASSLLGAILLKEKYPDFVITILEKNDQIGKKLKATGSGRCNIAPITDDINKFYNKEFVKNTIGKVPVKELLYILNGVGIPTKKIDKIGHYPISESAANVVYILEHKLKQLGINLMLNCKVLDYKQNFEEYIVTTSEGDFVCDHLVFANGGASYSSLGGEDTLSNVFISHGYKFNKQTPVMTPIKVKENIHRLNGLRLRANVKLLSNNNVVYEEAGEVQFRDESLSGIVILNISRYVNENKKYHLSIDVLNTDENCLDEYSFVTFMKMNPNFLYGLISKQLVVYTLNRLNIEDLEKASEKEIKSIYRFLTNFNLEVKSLYPLEYATVSRGGIDINDIDYHFSSKKEKGVYFLGEIIDADGPCGGFSLRFAFTSAIIFVRYF